MVLKLKSKYSKLDNCATIRRFGNHCVNLKIDSFETEFDS
jgi:hypothetical protein